MRALRTRAALAALLPLLLLAACGDEEPPPAARDAPTPQLATPAPASAEPSPAPGSEATDAVVALAALHYLRGQGFHDLATAVADAAEVNPRWSETATDAIVAVRGVPWPAPIAAAAVALIDQLTALADAVDAEDLDAALTAAEAIHDRDHDLQEVAYEWLAAVAPPDPLETDVAVVSVVTAIDVIDQAGFHGLAEEVATASETNPRWEGTALRALTALRLAAWPDAASDAAGTLDATLADLASAVSAGDLVAAITASEALHDAQHDLSEASYEWLAMNHRQMSHADAQLTFACLLRATDATARIDFHDLAAELAEATEIDPRLESRLENLLVVLDFETEDDLTSPFATQLSELREAVANGDLEAARAAAEAVHDVEHDFAHAAFEHMAAMHGDGMGMH